MSRCFWDELEHVGERIALCDETGRAISYRDLAAAADAFAGRIGGGRQLVLIKAASGIPTIIALLGCLRARHPVILSAQSGAERIIETFAPNAIVDAAGGISQGSAAAHALHEDLALMLSTSGSTGAAKLVRLSRDALHANAASIADYLGLTRDDVPVTTLPIAYSYGLSVVTSHLLAGARIVLTDRSVVDDAFWRLFTAQRATSLAGVPYTYELLEASGFRERPLPTLRTLTQAGGRIDARLQTLYSRWAAEHGIRFFLMYGQTEATARIAYLPPELGETYGDCIGQAIPGGALHVADAEGRRLPSGETGELVYAGPNVMMGYATAPAELGRGHEITALHTGDLAQEAAPGIFRIVGRLARFSKIAGLRVSLDEIERLLAANSIPAIVSGDDETIAVCLEDATACDRAERLIERNMAIPPRAVVIFASNAVPRLPSGKPDSPAILRAGKAIKAERDAAAEAIAGPALAETYARALNLANVAPEASFASLGGDSLGYIEVSLAIERLLGYLPDHWETLSIAQIEQLATLRPPLPAGSLVSVETEMLIRPIAMTTIVTGHVVGEMAGMGNVAHYWAGGAFALLVSAGYNICRFQKGTLLSERRLDVPVNYARRVLLPFYVLVLYKCIQWARGGPYVAWSTFLLLDDYIRNPGASSFLIYWFIGALFQCLLILTALFHVPAIRSFARRHGFWFGVALLAFAYAVKVAVHVTLLPAGALYFPNNQLDNWAYAFALGWMAGEARSMRQRLACIALGLVASHIDWGLVDLHTAMLMGSMLFILYLPRLRMPALAREVVALWARSTFFIYLTHGFAMAIMRDGQVRAVFGTSQAAVIVTTVALSTAMGVGFYLLWRRGERIVTALVRQVRRRDAPALTGEASAAI
ncbi:MAG: AMP-binding protein [Sphingobium sp.]|nr:AMP-binding protein [Sphingobium sp.]